ncbi:MAG: terminase family protein [Pseudomonadota bacterium]
MAWRAKLEAAHPLGPMLPRSEMLLLGQAPFLAQARAAQRPPEGDWRTWLFMGGRGAGKTRAGAEWARFSTQFGGCGRLALVGPTLGDAREVMIEGPSGIRSITPEHAEDPPRYEVSRRRLVWENGAEAHVFSAEDPDSLRGPQFDAAWCDEIAAWSRGVDTWDMLQLALRLGDDPRCVATTTPRPVALVKRLVNEPDTVLTRSTTAENAENLAPRYLAKMDAKYGGARLGRQELDGELIEDPEGALWTRALIDQVRLAGPVPDCDEIIVAVDPPAGVGPKADACGIVAAGVYGGPVGRQCAVIADGTAQGLSPLEWAGRAVALAERVGAARIVAEANQGGEMVRQTLETAGCSVPLRLIHARANKMARAAPVAALYETGRVAHAGVFRALEDEMCAFGGDGFSGSPDRVDALVWAVSALMLKGGSPRVRSF